MPYEINDDPINSAEAVEKLKNFSEESEPTRVAQFAQFIAGRLNPEIVPQGFVMASVLSIYDLQHGVDGFTGEPIEGDLVGLKQSEYDELLIHLPKLAQVAFPESFANAVVQHVIKSGIMPAPEASAKPTLNEGEIITEVIDNVGDAERLIVDDARERLVSLDWQHFGIDDDKVKETFDQTFALMLRQAPYNLSLNLMVDDTEHEAGLLRKLLPHHKKHLQGPYWLAMTADIVTPEYAMVTRDHIFLKGIEAVAAIEKVDPVRIMMYLANDVDGPANRASVRLKTYLDNHHPELTSN